jgi:alkanesulfonate monooxygenase SsuD/methylene tetrahydromethanopterin reductase-like flavin-dependent oxidoreductase (luciferase family)
MMGVQVANRTVRLRIGMAASLAAFYHPLRLAEEVALLDVFSGGRVNWGAGRGFDPTEFRIFGVPIEESAARFQEAVEITIAASQPVSSPYRARALATACCSGTGRDRASAYWIAFMYPLERLRPDI